MRGSNKGRCKSDKQQKIAGPHLTIDKLAAKRRLEQLKILATTDLAIVNSAESFRVCSFLLFKRNLLDPSIYLSTSFVFITCHLLTGNSSNLAFFVLFIALYSLVNYHIDSYKSFLVVNKNVSSLSKNYKLRSRFLQTHLGYDARRRVLIAHKDDKQKQTSGLPGQKPIEGTVRMSQVDADEADEIEERRRDTFDWCNRIVSFFWPYLSHLIHYELNDFFERNIRSGSLGRSNDSTKRLFYALLKQINSDILLIERCQLGSQHPLIKELEVFETTSDPIMKNQLDKKSESEGDKLLTYDFNLEYNGDMKISFIYRYLCCLSSRLGLKDIFLRFRARVQVGPIKRKAPYIDKITFTLLELPEFGYRGIALVELAELKTVKMAINRLIRDNILNPKSVTVSLEELMKALAEGKPPRGGNFAKNQPPKDNEEQVQNSASFNLQAKSKEQLKSPPLPLMTSLTARALLCGCLCSNFFLRCCGRRHRSRHRHSSRVK